MPKSKAELITPLTQFEIYGKIDEADVEKAEKVYKTWLKNYDTKKAPQQIRKSIEFYHDCPAAKRA